MCVDNAYFMTPISESWMEIFICISISKQWCELVHQFVTASHCNFLRGRIMLHSEHDPRPWSCLFSLRVRPEEEEQLNC